MQANAQIPPAIDDLKGLKVLVVDDNNDFLNLLSRQLSLRGAVVATAQDGREAISKSTHFYYDLILIDQDMPNMDGATTAAFLRAEHFERPIVLLTASDQSKISRLRGLKLFDEILQKPQSSSNLVGTLSRLSGSRHRPTAIL